MNPKRKKIVSVSFELLLIIVSIIVATYAWFNSNKELKTDQFIITTNSYTDLLISLDEGKTWSKELSLDIPTDYSFEHEITGNGINFYVASSKRDDGTPITFKQAAKTDYLEFDIWFKTSGNSGVFLDKNSYVLPTAGTTEKELIGNTVNNISSSGNFSRDLVAASMRLAFIDTELNGDDYILNSQASLVWAPNKQYEISCDNICTANLHSTNIQNYKFIDASQIGGYTYSNVNNLKDEIKATSELKNAFGDPMLTYIDTTNDSGIKKVTVRIWVEGNDRDNLTALIGGTFKMNLTFISINKQINNVAPKVEKNDNAILNFDKTMEYSTDNGINWISYNSNPTPTFSEGTTVFVRKSENSHAFASTYTTLNF